MGAAVPRGAVWDGWSMDMRGRIGGTGGADAALLRGCFWFARQAESAGATLGADWALNGAHKQLRQVGEERGDYGMAE